MIAALLAPAGVAMAQDLGMRSPGGVAPLTASLDGAGGAQGWRLTPSLSAGLTWSDNVRLAADGERVSDWSGRVEPGITLNGRTARATGLLRASVDANAYANESDLNRTNLKLFGVGTFDLYERRVMLDANASVSQERISSLGAPVNGVAYNPNNTTELRQFSVSPYIRGQWSNRITGELRYRLTLSDSSTTLLSNGVRQDLSVTLGNGANPAPFGWLLSGSASKNQYEGSNDTEFSNARLFGVYALDPTFNLRADVGYERNTFGVEYSQEQNIYGGGFEWTPSPRTRVTGMTEQRFFGTGYNYEANWRGPQSALSLSFARDVTTTSSTLNGGQLAGLLLAYTDSFGKQTADPNERFRLASQAWIERGLPLPSQIDGNTTYVTNSYYLEKRARLSSGINGVRNSIGVSATYSDRTRLVDEALLAPGDELATFDSVEEIGGTIVLSHRLTPISNLSALLGASRSTGQNGAAGSVDTRRQTATVTGSTVFGANTVGSVTYRHEKSRGATEYDENSVAATLGLRF
ncbi:TIGR03016 family PEP-CTERM system-associated outer membrane protein [Niveibacterium sp. 24ML]|nr:TIGR03016 family PEP-CTERM system-associated outer membrane protein [Niveibacterium sp. 24ML]